MVDWKRFYHTIRSGWGLDGSYNVTMFPWILLLLLLLSLFPHNDIVSSSFLLENERQQMQIDKNRKFFQQPNRQP